MILRRANVDRIAEGETATHLIEQGYKADEVKDDSSKLVNLKLEDLKAIAAEKNIEGYNSMKKDALIKAINELGE